MSLVSADAAALSGFSNLYERSFSFCRAYIFFIYSVIRFWNDILTDFSGSESKKLPARLSGYKRHAQTPALALTKTAPPTTNNTQPIRRPTPLGEISQNSQERSRSQPTQDHNHDDEQILQDENDVVDLSGHGGKENDSGLSKNLTEHGSSARKSTNDASETATMRPCKTIPSDASEFVSNFLARRKNPGSAPQEQPDQKVKRKLGRAASGSSITTSFVKPSPNPFVEDDSSYERTLTPISAPPIPSQQITYEAPSAAEHRRIMSRRMGTNFDDDSIRKRVETHGVVKDADSSRAVGERVRGRHRDVR